MVGRPSRRAGSGHEALPEGREWSGMVERPSWGGGSGQQALSEGWE